MKLKDVKKILEADGQIPLNQPQTSMLQTQLTPPQEQQIQVPGIGVYSYESLKSDLANKLQDMLNRVQQNDFHTLDNNNLDIVKLFWQTLKQNTPSPY